MSGANKEVSVSLQANQLPPGELDWFDFETRMRKLVTELLQPTLAQFQDEKQNYNKLRVIQEHQKKRFDELEGFVLRSDKDKTKSLFEAIYERISTEEKERKLESMELQQNVQEATKNIDMLSFKVSQQLSSAKQLETENVNIISHLKEFYARFETQREELNDQIKAITADTLKHYKELNEQGRTLRDRADGVEYDIDILKPRIKKLEEDIEKAKDSYSETKIQFEKLNQSKLEISTYNEFNLDIQRKQKIVNGKVEKIENMILTTDNYLEKYVPLSVERQLASAFDFISTDKVQRKLELYFKRRYKVCLNTIMEDQGEPDILSYMNDVNKFLTQTEDIPEVSLPYYAQKLAEIKEHEYAEREKLRNSMTPGLGNTGAPQAAGESPGRKGSKIRKGSMNRRGSKESSFFQGMMQQLSNKSIHDDEFDIGNEQISIISDKMKDTEEEVKKKQDKTATLKYEDFENLLKRVEYKFTLFHNEIKAKFLEYDFKLKETTKESELYIENAHTELHQVAKKLKKEKREMLESFEMQRLEFIRIKEGMEDMLTSNDDMAGILACIVEDLGIQHALAKHDDEFLQTHLNQLTNRENNQTSQDGQTLEGKPRHRVSKSVMLPEIQAKGLLKYHHQQIGEKNNSSRNNVELKEGNTGVSVGGTIPVQLPTSEELQMLTFTSSGTDTPMPLKGVNQGLQLGLSLNSPPLYVNYRSCAYSKKDLLEVRRLLHHRLINSLTRKILIEKKWNPEKFFDDALKHLNLKGTKIQIMSPTVPKKVKPFISPYNVKPGRKQIFASSEKTLKNKRYSQAANSISKSYIFENETYSPSQNVQTINSSSQIFDSSRFVVGKQRSMGTQKND